MSKPVLFITGLGESIDRAENLKVLYDAYKGDKDIATLRSPLYADYIAEKRCALMVTDIFPFHSPGKTILLWHAIQGGKYIGLDERTTYYKPEMANLIDCVIAAGRGGVDMMHRCTGVPVEKVVNLGMPRTDRYFGKKKGDGRTILAFKKAYLFVPTFRNKKETAMPDIDWKYLDEMLTDDEILAVKAHPLGKGFKIHGCKHIMEIHGMESTTKYLYDANVVITDYSSIMFDAYLMNKPVVLFEKNPGYTETRGMYLDYPSFYCSFYAKDEGNLLDMMRFRAIHPWLTDTELNCIDFVADQCDGHSCERICKLIDEMKGE